MSIMSLSEINVFQLNLKMLRSVYLYLKNGCALDKQSLKNKSVNRETVIYM